MSAHEVEHQLDVADLLVDGLERRGPIAAHVAQPGAVDLRQQSREAIMPLGIQKMATATRDAAWFYKVFSATPGPSIGCRKK